MDDLHATLDRVTHILMDLRLPFHLTGGIASIFYGEPRFTQDIDVVVRLAPGSAEVDLLIESLSEGFHLDAEMVRDEVSRQGMFQALDEQTFFKVDFHVGEAIPGELTRTRQQEIAPGVTVPLVNKEDAILSKLLWIRQGSGKSRQDVLSMLRRRSPLDQDYLLRQAERLGVAELLTEMREQAR